MIIGDADRFEHFGERFRRRVFLMAPLHHHFEMLGWSETQVTVRFWMLGMMAGLIGWFACALFASVAFNWTFYFVFALAVAAREIAFARRVRVARPRRKGISHRRVDLVELPAVQANLPIEHFVPRMMLGHRSEFVIGETAVLGAEGARGIRVGPAQVNLRLFGADGGGHLHPVARQPQAVQPRVEAALDLLAGRGIVALQVSGEPRRVRLRAARRSRRQVLPRPRPVRRHDARARRVRLLRRDHRCGG